MISENSRRRTRVKICGITRVNDAVAAAAAGADAIGLVFYPSSPRAVTIEQAREICAALPPFVTRVALFVNPEPAEVSAVLAALRVDLLQFHGEEKPDDCAAFGLPYIKAVRVQAELDLDSFNSRYARACGILLDTYQADVQGGTGSVFDWSVIPARRDKPLILAGGLTPENVAGAVRKVRPFAVDVSGGVETAKGIKDAARVAEFIHEVEDVECEIRSSDR